MTIQANFPAIKPSLLLDFANTKQLDSRITYTRASTATFYNGVTTAMAEQNLLLQSQTFNTSWNASNCTITLNSTTAPDGTTTASTLTALAGTASLYPNTAIPILANTNYTVSFYVKQGTGGWLLINLWTGSTNNGVSQWVNMSTGALGTSSATAGFSVTSSAVSNVGSGWYRVSLVGQSTTATNIYPNIRHVDGDNSFAFTTTTGLYSYIWGAQVEQRSAVTAYTATTTQAITNYIPVLQTAASGVARFDNNPTTGESLGLLIEESRTNLLTYSSQFDDAAWTKGGVSATANAIVSPDGTLNAERLVEDTSTGDHRIYQQTSFTSGTAYAFTVYAKAAGRNLLQLFNSGSIALNVTFDLSSGTITNTSSGTGAITSVGNGWYRCSVSATASATAVANNQIRLVSTGTTTSYTGDGWSGVYLWGAQVEAGAFATSYIPTVASQVTRAADAASMTGTNFSSWYNAGEGTLYAEAVSFGASSNTFSISDGTSSNWIYLISRQNAVSASGAVVNANGTTQASLGSFTFSTTNKIALGYKANDFGASVNSATVITDTSGIIPITNAAYLGARGDGFSSSQTIKKIAYYPLKVSSANLQALTS